MRFVRFLTFVTVSIFLLCTVAPSTINSQSLQGLDPPSPQGYDPPPTTWGINVFDSSNPPQFVGILVGIYPAGYKPSAGYEVGAMFTVYVPEVGKFIELSRGGEVIESRFRLEYVYYKVDGCDSSGGTYAIPEVDEVVDPAFISAHGFIDPSIGYIWSFYKVGDRQDVWLESRHTGVIGRCDDTPSGLSGAFTLTEVTLPFTIPLVMPLSFQ